MKKRARMEQERDGVLRRYLNCDKDTLIKLRDYYLDQANEFLMRADMIHEILNEQEEEQNV